MTLSPELRALVRQTMEIVGERYRARYGARVHARFMRIRTRMTRLRSASSDRVFRDLRSLLRELERESDADRLALANGLALMMEMMNVCENAYRSYRWEFKNPGSVKHRPGSRVTWVVTAHPTESRNPQVLRVLRELQDALKESLLRGWESEESRVRGLIALVVDHDLAPQRKPRPEDEADSLFTVALQGSNFAELFRVPELERVFRLRTWVGGDKDGHPGVDEKTLRYSWEKSRAQLLEILQGWLKEWAVLIEGTDPERARAVRRLITASRRLRRVTAGDAKRVGAFESEIRETFARVPDPASHDWVSRRIEKLFLLFPALVLPVEVRESSDVLEECARAPAATKKKFAIHRMLSLLAQIGTASQEAHYVQAFIVSMTHTGEDLRRAWKLMRGVSSRMVLPVVPLFETHDALESADRVLRDFLGAEKAYARIVRTSLASRVEVMLGYSDSSKQDGAFSSRVSIRRAMGRITKDLGRLGFKPYFFHGSGGSIDRGGGSFEETTQGWGEDAIRKYKATIQGEVVSRTFSSPKIFLSQLLRIVRAQSEAMKSSREPLSLEIQRWAEGTRRAYDALVDDPHTLELVQRATIYPELHQLRTGSRPSKRKPLGKVTDLRAIPWVLCWTQTRLLMPTWWGLGTSWFALSESDRRRLRRQARSEKGFLSAFSKQLRFTLAKVELGVWRLYLEERGGYSTEEFRRWEAEYRLSVRAVQDLTGEKDLMAFRPWLGESLHLRSALIHPLNCLQILALREDDYRLMRVTVTGIASGMLTTG